MNSRIRIACRAATTTAAILLFLALPVAQLAPSARADGGSAAPAAAPVQKNCPVLTDEQINPNFYTVYQGKKVYFCCAKCRAKFLADPQPYLRNLPQFAAANVAGGETAGQEQAPELTGWKKWAAYVGRFHVLAVHFPIALLLVAALFELMALRPSWHGLLGTVRPLSATAALAAVGAMALGLADSLSADYEGTLAKVFAWHRILGITTAVLAVAAFLLVERRHRSPSPRTTRAARIAVLCAAALVILTGHLGGSLVYGWSYLQP